MQIAIGADHAGFTLKQEVAAFLAEAGHVILDLGPNSGERVDYPDYAEVVGRAIVNGEAERGILLCGSGVGFSIAANKIPGIRAATCHDSYSAHQGVEHDNLNVLVLGAKVVGLELAKELVSTFLKAEFIDRGRYRRRLDKVVAIEAKYSVADKGRATE